MFISSFGYKCTSIFWRQMFIPGWLSIITDVTSLFLFFSDSPANEVNISEYRLYTYSGWTLLDFPENVKSIKPWHNADTRGGLIAASSVSGNCSLIFGWAQTLVFDSRRFTRVCVNIRSAFCFIRQRTWKNNSS